VPMASKKFYSDDDIQLAKAALSELPDLTAQRKTLRDFLDAIRDDIIILVRTKGYTLADVRDTLKNAGYEVGEKAFTQCICKFGYGNKHFCVFLVTGSFSLNKQMLLHPSQSH
jgi:hypothetical protein